MSTSSSSSLSSSSLSSNSSTTTTSATTQSITTPSTTTTQSAPSSSSAPTIKTKLVEGNMTSFLLWREELETTLTYNGLERYLTADYHSADEKLPGILSTIDRGRASAETLRTHARQLAHTTSILRDGLPDQVKIEVITLGLKS